MNQEFVDAFVDRLMAEFDCSERTALRVAKHAERHQRNSGNARTPGEWIDRLQTMEAGSVVERWKQVVAADVDDGTAGGPGDGGEPVDGV